MFTFEIKNEVAVIKMDRSGFPVNTWGDTGLVDLQAVINSLKAQPPKAAVIYSGKETGFHVGADLKEVAAQSYDDRKKGVSDSLEVLGALEALPFPVVAAVSGACMGGGMELALACTARVAADTKKTMLALPEVGVGLFPAGGGTQRLTRLIGWPALGFILKGAPVGVSEALSLGIIDKAVPEGELLDAATSFAEGLASGAVQLSRPAHDFSDVDTAVDTALKEHLKRSRGRLLPGPKYALEDIRNGINLPLNEALELEKKYFIDYVANSNEANGSIHTFLLKTFSSKASNFITPGYTPKQIKKAAVIGFGTMGRGIVIDILRTMGIPVVVKDIPEGLQPGIDFVRKILTKEAERGKLKANVDDLISLIIPVSDYTADFADVDIVIEAVFEDKALKRDIYGALEKVVPADCIIATNTSFLTLEELFEGLPHGERFCGLHFFSPVWKMQLLEVIKGSMTSQQTLDDAANFAVSIRKRPLICNDYPGFVVNAVMDPLMVNAYKFLEYGVPVEQIDRAMLSYGMPVGTIRLADEMGLDVSYHIFSERGIHIQTLENFYNDGRFGFKKCGKGFFLEDGSVDPEAVKLIAVKEKKELSDEDIYNGILADTIRAAKELLDKGIVSDPKFVDLGMIWGCGYPADKGGPLKWADLIGMSEKLFGKKFYA